jgi:predicted small lipoprotein YifL
VFGAGQEFDMAELSRRVFMAGVGASVLLALAGCGRRAGLDTPYQAGLDARREAEENNEPLPPEPKPPVTDRKFILDSII